MTEVERLQAELESLKQENFLLRATAETLRKKAELPHDDISMRLIGFDTILCTMERLIEGQRRLIGLLRKAQPGDPYDLSALAVDLNARTPQRPED